MTSDDNNRGLRLPANYYPKSSPQMSVLFIEPDHANAERLSRALTNLSAVAIVPSVHATPAMRHVLLMVVTARTGVRDKINAFQSGADDYLVKPLDPAVFALRVQLLSRFRKVISNSSLTL